MRDIFQFSQSVHARVPRRQPFVCSNQRGELKVKIEITEFNGRYAAEEFIDPLNTVERIFYYKGFFDDKKVKLVAIK